MAETLVTLAQEEPDISAEVLLFVAEQQKRDLVNGLPTWEMVEHVRKVEYERGFTDGYGTARNEMADRIFGEEEVWS